MIRLKDLLIEGISIRSTTHRGKDGFAIVGTLPGSNRRVNIFTTNRKSAEHIRDLVKAGKDVNVKDFQKYEANARLTEADAKFERAANVFLHNAQKLVDAHMKKEFSNLPRRILSFTKGKKYWRIVAKDEGVSQSGSAWAFLNTENGDVLKPASWRAPAKHARGNIYDSSGGMKTVGVYGPAYR